MRFSPSTKGWYPLFISYPALPDDLIDVPDALYAALLGKAITVGDDGMPREYVPEGPAPIPVSVTMRQARQALLATGRLAAVELAIASLPGALSEQARIDWEFAATVDRESPTVALLAGALDMTPEDLDQLFVLAASI
jgi:hypothetical protein